jgi:hypothetical protein
MSRCRVKPLEEKKSYPQGIHRVSTRPTLSTFGGLTANNQMLIVFQ